MAEERFLETRMTPTGQSGEGLRALPPDLCREASERLGVAAMVWAGLWTIGLVMHVLVGRQLPEMFRPPDIFPYVAAAGIAISLVPLWLSRRPWCAPELYLDLGLWFEVLLALLIGLSNQWDPAWSLGRISFICILILVHPLIAPSTPGKTLLASLAAASMDPLGLLLAAARGIELPGSPLLLVWTYLPNYVCAAIAVIPSRIISRLGDQVSRAREMGSYRLGELLGQGGMGEVWQASHRHLARPAAIKLIKPEALGAGRSESVQTTVERFRREAEAAAALQSPYTIDLYDFGVTGDGTLYYVMELLDGMDLERLIRQFGPLPPERVVHVLDQVCHSLAEAHAKGLVHRDVKPANIHLGRRGLDSDFVKILDFGLVKHLGGEYQEESLLTAPDITTGTPAYMAPEVALGESADGRSDLYSLGCVAHWLLTGRLVFEAPSAMSMVVQHVQVEPTPPSSRTELPIPPELDELVLACLQKKPEHRPADANDVRRRLQATSLSRRWTMEDAQRWWDTHAPAVPTMTAPTEPLARPAAPLATR